MWRAVSSTVGWLLGATDEQAESRQQKGPSGLRDQLSQRQWDELTAKRPSGHSDVPSFDDAVGDDIEGCPAIAATVTYSDDSDSSDDDITLASKRNRRAARKEAARETAIRQAIMSQLILTCPEAPPDAAWVARVDRMLKINDVVLTARLTLSMFSAYQEGQSKEAMAAQINAVLDQRRHRTDLDEDDLAALISRKFGMEMTEALASVRQWRST